MRRQTGAASKGQAGGRQAGYARCQGSPGIAPVVEHLAERRGSSSWPHFVAEHSLRNVRPWGPVDRVTDETIELWREALGAAPPLRIEAELYYHNEAERRAVAYQRMEEAVADAGRTISKCYGTSRRQS